MSTAHTALRELVSALGRAQRAFDAGNRDAARAAAAEALAIDPANVQALDLLAALDQAQACRPSRRPHRPAAGAAPAASGPPHGVVNTASWVAFEGRVRERRITRLLTEASAANLEGRGEDAARALDELHTLAPGDERVAELERALAERTAPLVAGVGPTAMPMPGAATAVPAAAPRRTSAAGWLAAAAVLAAALGGWTAHRQATARDAAPITITADASLLPSTMYAPAAPADAPDLAGSVVVGTVGEAPPEAARAQAPEPSPASRPPPDTRPSPARPEGSSPAPPTAAREPAPTPEVPASASQAPQDTASAIVARAEPRPALPAPASPAATPVPETRAPLPAMPPVTTPAAPEASAATTGRGTPPAPAAAVGTNAAVDPSVRPAAALDADTAARQVLDDYRLAYNSLDAGAAQRIWPTVDSRALERAFRQLQSQSLSFDRCEVTATGAAGQAVCRGRASWAPAVGDRNPRQEARTWRFTLSQRGNRWVITNVAVDRQ